MNHYNFKKTKFYHLLLIFLLYSINACWNMVWADNSLNYSLADGSLSIEAQRIIPESDFEYLGAFRLPYETSNGANWNGGGLGMTYYPDGDIHGADDGFPGSLYSIGRGGDGERMVSEFTIPVPVVSSNQDINSLPMAETLQAFVDVTGGLQNPSLEFTLGDIQYMPEYGLQEEDSLYWVMYEYFNPPAEKLTLGSCSKDLTNLNSQGPWHFGEYASALTSRYLFDIPVDWADEHTEGKYLASGRFRGMGGGSPGGPTLYASAAWNDGNPPSVGSNVDTLELLKYGSSKPLKNFSKADDWRDGAWLTTGTKSAVVIAGKKGFRRYGELETYGDPQPDEMGYKGYHANPYYGAMLFYDTVLFSKVMNGEITSEELQPYAIFNLHNLLYNSKWDLSGSTGMNRGRRTEIGGVAFDRKNSIFYVIEYNVEGYYATGKPIIHVFRLSDHGLSSDTTPPTIPANVRVESVTSDQIALSWDPSLDDGQLAGYIVFRDGRPIDPTIDTHYTDNRINPNGHYEYSILAWDSRGNKSEKSLPISVETPNNIIDNRLPLISNVHILNITENSATISWYTDEPTTSRLDYKIAYSADDAIEYFDPELKREHIFELTNLELQSVTQQYICHIFSEDEAGNENKYYTLSFETSFPNENNVAPVLIGIGAQRVLENTVLAFSIDAFDKDQNDQLVFSVKNLPDGAVFDPETQNFSWTPSSSQIGIHRMTFIVSDGDQSDSEEVAIFVENLPQAPPGNLPPDDNNPVDNYGDLDQDLDIDGLDLYLLISFFGLSSDDEGYNPRADFNDDGIINQTDIALFIQVFGS